jgi:hypothetical protein
MDDAVWDKEKGELLIRGTRHTAIDAQTLCNHLDSLTGIRVAEVIMQNLEARLGKLDVARLKAEKPKATLPELVEYLAKTSRLSGLGITNVTLPEDAQKPIEIEIANPGVKGTAGAAKAFAFSWWAGAFTELLGKDMEAKSAFYDEKENILRCQIEERVLGGSQLARSE